MLKKSYSKTGSVCRVTFKCQNDHQAENACLAGDFNSWSPDGNPMKKLKDGSFSITLSLPAKATYAFRYVLDGKIWVNDSEADGYVANEFGEENGLVQV